MFASTKDGKQNYYYMDVQISLVGGLFSVHNNRMKKRVEKGVRPPPPPPDP